MVVLLTIATLAGFVLGLRLKVSVLIPATLLATAVTITCGIVSGHAAGVIAFATLGILTSLQIGYLVGSVLEAYLPVRITLRFRLSELPHR